MRASVATASCVDAFAATQPRSPLPTWGSTTSGANAWLHLLPGRPHVGMFVRSVIKRGVGPSGAAEFEAVPAREEYESGDEGSVKWAQDMLGFTDDNNDGGIEVRSMDSRDCKVGLFGADCLERVRG